jgi:hypothetical protein
MNALWKMEITKITAQSIKHKKSSVQFHLNMSRPNGKSSGWREWMIKYCRFAACKKYLQFTWKLESQAKLAGYFSPDSALH